MDAQGFFDGLPYRLARAERQGRVLEHHLDLPPVGPESASSPERVYVHLPYAYHPRIGAVQPGHDARQGRLAAARLADQPHDLTGRHTHRDVALTTVTAFGPP